MVTRVCTSQITRARRLPHSSRWLQQPQSPKGSDSAHFSLDAARLTNVRPTQEPVPLLVGGNGPRVLRFASANADPVGITGLGKLLDDGHHHTVEWGAGALQRSMEVIAHGASAGKVIGISDGLKNPGRIAP